MSRSSGDVRCRFTVTLEFDITVQANDPEVGLQEALTRAGEELGGYNFVEATDVRLDWTEDGREWKPGTTGRGLETVYNH
ncbi:hypothetical protein LCGC14_0252350 [marine sediment metagenome]|uniref:Uncharacterized protein n=1 Tax=marine sediment metagenome TaxID=412755 RepID=A0A0F9X965_9ZZZZ